MKKLLLKIYYFGNNSKEKIEYYQKKIRDVEWNSVADFIPEKSTFLDIGCGSGYSMKRASGEKNCLVKGIDPEPFQHGVGRNWEEHVTPETEKSFYIWQGNGESLPFNDSEFDIVYSSHVLEHVQNELIFLREANRVLKNNGTFIIGMPTASMAWLSFLSQILFTSHHRIVNFIFSRIKIVNVPYGSFINILFPVSHSFADKTLLYDFKHYKINNWRKLVSAEFKIIETILPGLYPYPDYIQLFKLKKRKNFSSSVFFICKKKCYQ